MGSNDKDRISAIIIGHMICCIDMPSYITIVLVIDKHARHCRGSTSPGYVMNISEAQLETSVTMSLRLDNAFNVKSNNIV